MSGATYAWDTPWLGLFAWVPAIVAQHAIWPRALQGVAMGLAWFSYLGINLVPKLMPEIGLWVWALPAAVGIVSAILEQQTVTRAQSDDYRSFWWQTAFAYTAVEMGRSFIPGVATWAAVGYSVIASPGWSLAASWIGIFGLSLGVWASNFALAHLLLIAYRRAPWHRSTGMAAVLVVAIAFGLLLVPSSAPPADRPTLRVAAIQPGFDLYEGEWNTRRLAGDDMSLSRDLMSLGFTYSREAVAQGARLIVWPEGFLRVIPQDHPEFKDKLENFARETGVTLAVGYAVETPAGRRNEVAMITPEADWLITGKAHPVPWAETGSVTRGQVASLALDGYRVGSMICFDADYTDTTRARAREGARLLAAPAHDWPAIGRARAVHLRARAAENRLPIVMADWMVGSAAVDARGRIIAHMPFYEKSPGVMIVDVPVGDGGVTPYANAGDIAGWLSICATIFFLLRSGRAQRRRPRPQTPS